jgi:hypothetical protein
MSRGPPLWTCPYCPAETPRAFVSRRDARLHMALRHAEHLAHIASIASMGDEGAGADAIVVAQECVPDVPFALSAPPWGPAEELPPPMVWPWGQLVV